MPQIVFTKCVHCEREIQAVNEGQFCSSCGHPAHNLCVQEAFEKAARQAHQFSADLPSASLNTVDTCPICAGPVGTAQAVQQRLEDIDDETRHRRIAALEAHNDILTGTIITLGLGLLIGVLALLGVFWGLLLALALVYGVRRIARGVAVLRQQGRG